MKKTFYTWLEIYTKIPSSLWVDLWGFVALVRFAHGLPVDPVFLGVLGIYAGGQTIKQLKGPKDDNE